MNDTDTSEVFESGMHIQFDALLNLGRIPGSTLSIANREDISLTEPVSFEEIIINPELPAAIFFTAGAATTTKGVI